MPEYFGVSPNAIVATSDQYRLVYELVGLNWHAAGVEARLYTALLDIGLVPRSLPSASEGDAAIVIRVQPSDLLKGKTVGQMAGLASFPGFDFSLGFNFAIGLNVDLVKVEFLSPSEAPVTLGTQAIPSDTLAQAKANAAANEDDWAAKLIRILKGTGVVLAIGLGVYLYVRFRKGK
jgi:hypothetical protein